MNKLIGLTALIGCLFYFKNYLMKGGEDMVAVYVALIIHKRRTLKSVPKRLQEAVKAELLALGLDENGNPIEEVEA